jgi:hypothetical protein
MADEPGALEPEETLEHQADQLDAPLDSPTLNRLLEEVRGQDQEVPRSYNRTYNRHNR